MSYTPAWTNSEKKHQAVKAHCTGSPVNTLCLSFSTICLFSVSIWFEQFKKTGFEFLLFSSVCGKGVVYHFQFLLATSPQISVDYLSSNFLCALLIISLVFYSSFVEPFWDRGVAWLQLFIRDVLLNAFLQVLSEESPRFFWVISTC